MFFSSFSDFISDVIRLANDFRKVTEIDAVISDLREEGGGGSVLWIGITLLAIRIRISMLMPIQIRILIGINMMSILKRILPQDSQGCKIQFFFF
jgi:hypothetical protein